MVILCLDIEVEIVWILRNQVATVKSQAPALNPRPWGILGILVLKIVRNYGIGRAKASAAAL